MSHRPLVFVSGLAVADYLLWNWSLNSNHDVLALVSGLTLPPLAVAGLWLLCLTIARLIAHSVRSPARRAARRSPADRRHPIAVRPPARRRGASGPAVLEEPVAAAAGRSPSRKIAA